MNKKIGILGGGQLGRMFLQAAYDYPFEYHILDTENAPCQSLCEHYQVGDFSNYDDVLAFGQQLDVIGIEIEHVNTEALKVLENQGKKVIPTVDTLNVIQDKGLQKQYYKKHNISTPDYYLINTASELDSEKIAYPFVQKLRIGGYDGKGVQVINHVNELDEVWDEPSVIEVFTSIDKEIAVMVAKGQDGNIAVYPTVEMVFNPELNLVDYLFSPANMGKNQQMEAVKLAKKVADSFKGAGIFAVELFLDTTGKLWVNEVAPRVHNSGHHTIEASYCSQFEQMLRILADLPLGNPELREGAAMINLVGEPNYNGYALIDGLEYLAKLDKTAMHWYGKTITAPGRKMGHITVLGDKTHIDKTLSEIKDNIKVIATE
ncbi:MAG: 5-(carboxyamino)imidazole ribonucleotide synthase [Ostreibacterium sp.]